MSTDDDVAATLFAEILTLDQLARARVTKALPNGMELSHFTVLNHLAHIGQERTPAQLAKTFHLTRGAMTNRLQRLEWAGWIHIRPDWDDARQKLVAISPAGKQARDVALHAMSPVISETVRDVGSDRVRAILPILRDLRLNLSEQD